MVIEGYRKQQSHNEKAHQHRFVIGANNGQPDEANSQNYKLGCHDVSEDSTHKETFFTLEESTAVGAVMSYMKWTTND